MQDDQIVSLYWQRDEAAIMHTQNKYQRYLSKIAYNILLDLEDAEECVNDTYLAAWNSMPVQRPAILSTYLGKIVRQLSISVYRKKHTQKRLGSEYVLSLEELGDTFPDTVTPEQLLDKKLLSAAINRFLLDLPWDARNVFIGRYFFFDSLKEVARYSGMGEAKVKSMLYRTRQNLKAYLREEGFTV